MENRPPQASESVAPAEIEYTPVPADDKALLESKLGATATARLLDSWKGVQDKSVKPGTVIALSVLKDREERTELHQVC
jgi:hypothetical protein